MTGKRNIGSVTVVGGLSAAIALLTGLPAVSADELGSAGQSGTAPETDRPALAGAASRSAWAVCAGVRAGDPADRRRRSLSAASRDRF